MAMFATIVAAAFIWTLVPGETGTVASRDARAPLQETMTTPKTSRLSLSDVERACRGQNWGGESAECLKMIARGSGKTVLKVRMIADAGASDIETPNVF